MVSSREQGLCFIHLCIPSAENGIWRIEAAQKIFVERMDRWMDRRIDGWMGGQMNGEFTTCYVHYPKGFIMIVSFNLK